MNQKTRSQVFSYFVMAAVLLVTATMLVAIFSLKSRAETGHDSEEQAHAIEKNCHALNALEWQAIASEKMEAATMAEIEDRRTNIDKSLDILEQRSLDDTRLATMRQVFVKYKKATDDEFALISAGHIPEAVATDEESVDPLFKRLVEMADETATGYRARAISDNNLSYYLISLISLLTVIITGILLWLYSRVLRKSG